MGAERRPWRARRRARAGGVRLRTTVAAVVVVGVAMAVGAVVLVEVLRTALTGELAATARLRAAEVADALEAGTAPDPLAVGDAEDLLVQVLDERGAVVRSSPNVAGRPPVARLRPGGSAKVAVPIDNEPFLAVAVAASTWEGPRTVVVARAVDLVGDSTRILTGLLAVGLPLLLLVVAATTWRVAGRALAPVAAITGEVEAISAAELHRRVPDPPGDDEVARLARTMNRMLDRLQRAHERQRRFVADASHELRTPVAAVRQHAEVALAHPGGTSTAELARTVLAEDLRIQRLVEDLLLLARADEHAPAPRRRQVDLDDLVFEEVRRLRAATAVAVDAAGVCAGRVDGDAAALRRVLRNLGDNAARHAAGRVAFALARRDGAVVLTVDDDGPGIPAADRRRVLERFVRLDDARAGDAGGSGLGLAIVAEVVAAHGGTVAVGDGPLGGARVEVALPAAGPPPG
jgi:signal transduction histidine kinase